MHLTHYHTTNFRLFQIDRVCRRQFPTWWKWQKVIQMGRKHCGKRRNCSLWAISPFPTVFSKASLYNWTFITQFQVLTMPRIKKVIESIVEKGENAVFSIFPQCILLYQRKISFELHLFCCLHFFFFHFVQSK